jgi:glucosamine kinase
MQGWLGIDMGGTACRWAWLADDGSVLRGTATGATAMVYDAPRRAAFLKALQGVRAALPGPPAGVHMGLTGAGFTRDPALNDLAAQALGLWPRRISHENDAELAHRAAFCGGAGHLIIAGTGSIGVGVTDRGHAVVGGRGVVIDDPGSASWIAARALQAVYARLDATGRYHGVEALAEALGCADWDSVRARVYGSDRGELGLMAPAVARVAQGGCPVAMQILTGAGQELVGMAKNLTDRLGPARMAFAGGVFRLAPQIKAAVRASWPDAGFPDLDAPLAAARHARTIWPDPPDSQTMGG